LRTTCGEAINPTAAVADMWLLETTEPAPSVPHSPVHADRPHGTLDSILRSVFPKH